MAKKIVGDSTVSGSLGVGTTTPTGTLDVRGGTNATGAGTPITITAQNSLPGTSNIGGAVLITAGDSSKITSSGAIGGSVTVKGGKGAWVSGTALLARGGTATLLGGEGNVTGNGGNAIVQGGLAGATSGNGGAVTVTGGTPLEGAGGAVGVSGSSAVSTLGTGNFGGGAVNISGGASTGTQFGGTVSITSGAPTGTGTSGNVSLTTANPANGNCGDILLNLGYQQGSGTHSSELVCTFNKTGATTDFGSAKFYGVVPNVTNKGLMNIGLGITSFDGSTSGHFAGSAFGTGLAMNLVSGYNGNLADWQVAGVSKFSISNVGRVAAGGLNITGPYTNNGPLNYGLSVQDDNTYSASPAQGIRFGGQYNSSGAYNTTAGIMAGKENATDNDRKGYLAFYTVGSTDPEERMRISSGGGVAMTNDATINSLTVGRGAGNDSSNTVVGNLAFASNTSGYDNSAVGGSALNKNTTGSYNTAIGFTALYQNTTGDFNSALGTSALTDNTTGSYNSVFGAIALNANGTGNYNSAFGNRSLLSNVSGSGNLALGNYAGAYETGSNAFYVDNQNRTDTSGDKSKALLYGTFNATASAQTLKANAAFTATYGINSTAITSAINTQTGTTYTLALTDASAIVEMSNAASNTLTIPLNSSTAFPVGTTVTVIQYGAGLTTVAGASGVTVNGTNAGSKATTAQYQGLALYKRATDEWIVVNK